MTGSTLSSQSKPHPENEPLNSKPPTPVSSPASPTFSPTLQPDRHNPASLSAASPLRAFSAYGIELEFMIVERDGLSVLPIADLLLQAGAGEQTCDVDRGLLGWSNELALHVIEVKNQYPAPSLGALLPAMQAEVRYLNRLLDLYGARLMPTAMHPWMDPRREMRLWPHDHAEIYGTYARIFDCRTHGWANLQSMHVNLPFASDEEFARLHAAVRLVLPVLPALAASSPFAEGRNTGFADYRMHTYAGNAAPLTTIAARVIPNTVCSRAQYEKEILEPMYRELAPHDPEGLLRHEWLNSRGAIARFDRNAIEIRVIDTQECPHADLSIAAAAIGIVHMLMREGQADRSGRHFLRQQEADTGALAAILDDCIRDAERAHIADAEYLALLGYPKSRCSAQQLWRHLVQKLEERKMIEEIWRPPLHAILEYGPLARRILRETGPHPHARLPKVYRRLCECLHEGRMFIPA